ncbi:hypothetical protein E6W36_01350 [Hankyongella ginsenosidimutans]|uniref:Uncharacterized protein n=1 Tax=Hankyongella ginsenosidimutans TaxID=1763828 RepID=A0A4D7BT42_9SPHN|nr:hypothetical protein [Hankyongella ginsenosidimutans]QCI78769.1 hypothetical protein E6W36_01350 [Hankyongella ginsenosidimutans]
MIGSGPGAVLSLRRPGVEQNIAVERQVMRQQERGCAVAQPEADDGPQVRLRRAERRKRCRDVRRAAAKAGVQARAVAHAAPVEAQNRIAGRRQQRSDRPEAPVCAKARLHAARHDQHPGVALGRVQAERDRIAFTGHEPVADCTHASTRSAI